jgi:DNA repair exonuclease SbcCD ATPase subunit
MQKLCRFCNKEVCDNEECAFVHCEDFRKRNKKTKDTFLICPYIPDHEMSEIRKSQDPTIKRLYSAIVDMSADYEQLKDEIELSLEREKRLAQCISDQNDEIARLKEDCQEEVENSAKHVHCDVCQEKIAELERKNSLLIVDNRELQEAHVNTLSEVERLRDALKEIVSDGSTPNGSSGEYYGMMRDRLSVIEKIAKEALGE